MLGCQLTQLAFSICLVLFLEMTLQFELSEKAQIRALLVFALLPSCILTTAVTMREAYQILGMLLYIYGLTTLRIKRNELGLLFTLLGTLTLILFHKGFALLVLLTLPASLLWAYAASAGRMLAAIGLGFLTLPLLGDILWSTLVDNSSSLRVIMEGNAFQYIDNYADQVEIGRTQFDISLDLSSLSSALTTGPIVFIYYLLSPLPWQIRGFLDIEGVMESFLRAYLLYHSYKGLKSDAPPAKGIKRLYAAIFLATELMWAAGTANWGTAIRHRLVAWPLLVLVGFSNIDRSRESSETQNKASPPSQTGPRALIRKRRERLRKEGSNRQPSLRRPDRTSQH